MRRRRATLTQYALLTGSLLLAMSCADPSTTAEPANPPAAATTPAAPPATGGGDQPVTAPAASPGTGTQPDSRPSPVTPKGPTLDPRPVPWTSVTDAGDDRARIVWWSGVEPCHTLDRVAVDETENSVEITIYEGTPENQQNVACIEIAIQKTTTVTLKHPLGDRTLIDGAKK
ncbi:hypothetical protein Misp01_40280 [Microtetraspora sp. NBRC 13810]|uniref:hypothetical protein n=1 Tax=Microtetraspora sp. NBRC 13810 TaxID=3030990 RepID=UPI00255227F0|nr:hypothetical protein [Microtetraspora sp. NBRC 13810]GLW08898.1 hypothetical protein Misp01_40280 [Microtetraspora sp. NBRC 13810]